MAWFLKKYLRKKVAGENDSRPVSVISFLSFLALILQKIEHIFGKQHKCMLIALGVLALAGCRGGGPEGEEQILAVSRAPIAAQSEKQIGNTSAHPASEEARQSDSTAVGAFANEEKSAAVVGLVDASALHESFDGITLTSFGAALVNDKNVHLISGKGVNGTKAIRVDYRGNSKGSERAILNYKLPRALQYTLSFDVNFCPGFDFRKGGKLHGLGPANPVAGGNEVSPARWSARGMFRQQGGLQSYVYSQNMAGKYGDVFIAKGFHFRPGRYYAITYQIVLNNPVSSSNGFIRVFVNGTPVIYHGNIKFRSTDSLDSQISTLMFNTFHGGHTPDWAPRNAEGSYAVVCAYFDNFSAIPSLQVRYTPGM